MRAGFAAALFGLSALRVAAPAACAEAVVSGDWIEDGALCLRIAMERDADGRLRAAALRDPRYQLGLRSPERGCQAVLGPSIDSSALAEHLEALRSAAERIAERDCAPVARLGGLEGAQTPQLHAPECAVAEPAPNASATAIATEPPPGPDPLAAWRDLRDRLQPDGLRIDGAWDRDRAGQRVDSELNLRARAHWQGGPHRIELELEHQQRRRDGQLRKNQQLGSFAWTTDLGAHWFFQSELELERDRVNIEGFSLDYLLTQAASGFGPRWQPHPALELRLAAQWYRLRLRLLDLGASVYADGPAAFAQAHWRPLPRLSLNADARLTRWPEGSEGLDLNAELLFELSRKTGLGLRRSINRNTASLKRADEDEVELFLRYRF